MPLAISISIGLILIALAFHGQLLEQVKKHMEQMEQLSKNYQIEIIDLYETIF